MLTRLSDRLGRERVSLAVLPGPFGVCLAHVHWAAQKDEMSVCNLLVDCCWCISHPGLRRINGVLPVPLEKGFPGWERILSFIVCFLSRTNHHQLPLFPEAQSPLGPQVPWQKISVPPKELF